MIEVFQERGQWVVFDLDSNVYFTRDGTPLSFIGFTKAVTAGDCEMVTIAADTALAVPFRGGGGFDYTFYGGYIQGSQESREGRYARVIQVPLIESDGDYWFYHEEERELIDGYSGRYKYLPYEEWMETFYPVGRHGL